MHAALISSIDLTGRVAYITGAGGGIGRATAERLAQAGAALFLVDIDQARLLETARAVEWLGGIAATTVADVSNVPELERAVAEGMATHGRIDILVNNASILVPQAIGEVDEDDWQQTIDINLKGYFFLSKIVARHMVERGDGGSIVNIASQAYLVPRSGMTTYATSKGGVVAMTRAFARELGAQGIRVNALSPGSVDTESANQTRLQFLAAAEKTSGAPVQPAPPRSVFGRPASADEIADAVLFFACDLSRYVTAATLSVDGGFVVM